MKTGKTLTETTPDDAYFTVGGRRWRATDPHVPDPYRRALVSELMSARRGVRNATTQAELLNARARVQDAKVALGERGHPWWLPAQTAAMTRRIEAAMRALLRHRGPGGTVVASDVARIVDGRGWRRRLPDVRACATEMIQRGELEVRRRTPGAANRTGRSVIRYRLADMTSLHHQPTDTSGEK